MTRNCMTKIISTFIFCFTLSTAAQANPNLAYENFENTFKSPMLTATINYPFFVNNKLNLENLKFINDTFTLNFNESFNFFSEEQEFVRTNLGKDQKLADNTRQNELGISYEVNQVKDIVSTLWNVYTYTGGAHGNIQLHSQIYDTKENKLLSFKDFFPNQKEALALLAELSPKYIQMKDYDLDLNGLSAELENFETFTLYPDFIRISFQPYQIAPWSAGLISCDIPLKELEKVINKKYL